MSDNNQRRPHREPAKYRMIFPGCNHQAVMSEEELHYPIEQQFDPATRTKENVHVCPSCAIGERRFCHNSVLHPVETATRLTPLDDKRIHSHHHCPPR
jgi:hypothetical protein